MATHRKNVPYLGSFIHGSFEAVKNPQGEIARRSPADFEDTFATLTWSTEHVDRAVAAAREAFKTWKKTTQAERIACLERFKEQLKDRKPQLAELLAREVGKPLWEANTEIDAMIGKIDISVKDGLKEIETREIPEIQAGVFGVTRYKPLGVVAVLGPFNFPAHLPNGHWVPALLAGNTVVFKPSEQAPYIAQAIAECFQAAALPAGVFNVVQGERAVGERLVSHNDVMGVFFTGSYNVGRAIKLATIDQPHKLLALEMGGKNSSIVCADAHIELALSEVVTSAFFTTGQRCSATSRILVHKSLVDKFSERLVKLANGLKIAHPLENPFMGPIINEISKKRYLEQVASAKDVTILKPALPAETTYKGHYITPSLSRFEYKGRDDLRAHAFLNEELFAPHATVIAFDEIEEAVEIANTSEYGLVGSVFTASPDTYRTIFDDLDCGLINWNKSTVGGSSKLPFGGLKKSGNYFPTALFAARYCGHPVASLENRGNAFSKPTTPGMTWE